jgi:hypothetical protein
MPSFYEELVAKLTNPKKQKPYKESSVKPVYRYLTTLNGGVAPTSLEFLLDRPIVMKFLEKFAVNTQRTIIFAIRNVAKDFDRDDILELWKENIEETEAGKGLPEKNEKSEAQEKAYALVEGDEKGSAWDNILKRVEGYEGYAINKLSSKLYTMFPPRRNLDYTEMKIADGYNESLSKEFNYLAIYMKRVGVKDIEGTKKKIVSYQIVMKFVFNRYKTDGVYKQKVYDVPEPLTDELKKYIKDFNIKDGDFLLQTSGGKKLRSDDLTDILHKVFGAGISTQMLRHMYLDKYGGGLYDEVIKEMMDDADKMGHSLSMQQNTYVKK